MIYDRERERERADVNSFIDVPVIEGFLKNEEPLCKMAKLPASF